MRTEPVHAVLGDGGAQMPLRCSVRADTTSSTISVAGELDADTAPLLEAVVAEQIAGGHVDVRLDVSALTFCGVRGLDVMVSAKRRLQASGGDLSVLHPSPFLARIARLCGAGAILSGPA